MGIYRYICQIMAMISQYYGHNLAIGFVRATRSFDGMVLKSLGLYKELKNGSRIDIAIADARSTFLNIEQLNVHHCHNSN